MRKETLSWYLYSLINSNYFEKNKEITKKDVDKFICDNIDKIQERFREPIMLVDVKNLTYREASKRLNISIGTIQSKLARGRIYLMNTLYQSYLSCFECIYYQLNIGLHGNCANPLGLVHKDSITSKTCEEKISKK